jgi:FkbM family methyltransferase
MEISKILNKNFVIFDIGSSFAKSNKILKKYSQDICYLEIDALSVSEITDQKLYKNIKIRKGIHTLTGPKEFIERQYIETSSFLDIRPGMIEQYGMDYHFKEVKRFALECVTVSDILKENNLNHIDFLKTDVEGLDFDIIQSIESMLPKVNVIKSEIRFEPFYIGEKPFYEVCKYLSDHGFQFINFSNLDEWKYKTTNQKKFRDGRMVWGDFIFFRKLDKSSPQFTVDLVKQILIAKSLNLNSHAEYLLESNEAHFEKKLYQELKTEITNFGLIESILNSLFLIISKTKFIHPIKKTLKFLYLRSRIQGFFPQGI